MGNRDVLFICDLHTLMQIFTVRFILQLLRIIGV
jgi:hypothetical protein